VSPHPLGEDIDVFWFPEINAIWCWSQPTQHRRRLWIRSHVGLADIEPLAELPPFVQASGVLIGLSRSLSGPWALFMGGLPDRKVAEFIFGNSLKPTPRCYGAILLRWTAEAWQSIRIAGLSITDRGPVFHSAQVIAKASVGYWFVPEDWLTDGPTELLVTPVSGDHHCGPTERVAVPQMPSDGRVVFNLVRDASSKKHWLGVSVSSSERRLIEVNFSVTTRLGVPPMPVTLTTAVGGHSNHEYHDIITGDKVTASVRENTPCRFFYTHAGSVPIEIKPESANGCVYTFGMSPNQLIPLVDRAVSAAEFTTLLAYLSDHPGIDTATRRQLALYPAGVLIALKELVADPTTGEAAELLGVPASDVATDYLRRPQNYRLLREPLVRSAARQLSRAECVSECLNCLPELVTGRQLRVTERRPPPMTLDSFVPRLPSVDPAAATNWPQILSASDKEVDYWLEGLAEGITREDCHNLLVVRGWRCPVPELARLLRGMRELQSDPLAVLADEVTSEDGLLRRQLSAAIHLEESSRSMATLASVRASIAARTAALACFASQLEAAAGATHADAVAPVLACLRAGKVGAAANHLSRLRHGKSHGGFRLASRAQFRVELVWLAEAMEREEATRRSESQAGSWALELLRNQTVPAWPPENLYDTPTILPKLLSVEWERRKSQMNEQVLEEASLDGKETSVKALLRDIRRSLPEGRLAAILTEMSESAHLQVWLDIPRRRDELLREAVQLTNSVQSRIGGSCAAVRQDAIRAALVGRMPKWTAATDELRKLRELVDEESAWASVGRRLLSYGLPSAAVDSTDPSAIATWVRSLWPATMPADSEALNTYVEAVACGDCSEWLTGSSPVRQLFPSEYEVALRIASYGATLGGQRKAFLDWLARGFRVFDPHGVCGRLLAVTDRATIRRRAAELKRLPAFWDTLRWLTLDSYGLSPSLAELLTEAEPIPLKDRPRRELAAEIRHALNAAADLVSLIDTPGRVQAFVESATRRRDLAGDSRRELADLREYLIESRRWPIG
jgi:hypothetical protein